MKQRIRNWGVPLVLLVVLGVSFGLLIPLLGFYWDDWPVILTGRYWGAEGFLHFYQYDRPVSAWTYIAAFPLLGSRPLNWHFFSLALRWATVVAMWWTLIRLWPARRAEAAWAALLFAVYPVFTQQAIAVAYSQHWTCYLLFFISLGAMVQAQRSAKRWYWPLTLLAVAASLLQLLTMEYFAGLELLRPLILWFILSESVGERRSVLARKVFWQWLPYLLALVGFVIWRLFFLEFPGESVNEPLLLYQLFQSPLAGGLRLLQLLLQDTVHLMLSVWANTLAPTTIDLADRSNLASWAVALLVGALLAVYLAWMQPPAPRAAQTQSFDRRWAGQILLLGAAGVALGMLPVWLTDRQIIVGAYSNRFGLPAMFGASLLLVGLLDRFVRLGIQRIALVGLLVGLAAGMHLRIGNDYRWTWIKQTRFYWQLSWRAPALQPGTAIFSDGELFPSVGIYSTAMGINLIYPPAAQGDQFPYWFSSLGREFLGSMDEFLSDMPIRRSLRNFEFNGNTGDGIVIYYEPEENNCMEVLSPADSLVSDLPAITQQAVVNSNLGRIIAQPSVAGYPPQEIFGPEPEHTWCYFYEKGALSWQERDWAQVAAYGDEARQQGYHPLKPGSNTPLEWTPFIEGYARQGRWQDAQDLSLEAFERTETIAVRLCSLWNDLSAGAAASPEGQAALQAVRSALNCAP